MHPLRMVAKEVRLVDVGDAECHEREAGMKRRQATCAAQENGDVTPLLVTKIVLIGYVGGILKYWLQALIATT